ncbi:twin-arginine translocation signal domain-containing protein [Saccharicrinis aurantiacus]|uniref:twin-arginine translocation signal domain-containing protein n=1 Tax=Saccharicrinis aurantiacus TaxID=1849719 RepID=UPI000837D0BD|nr:twin-arginine translocation signal domain-containing protein [Saccharicrinis aurantiacus]
MSNRRNFLKTAGLGLAAGAVACTTAPKSKIEQSEDGYASGSTVKGTRKIETVRIKVKAPLLVPYNSQSTPEEKGTGYNFFRSEAFNHNPFTINCGGISGSPIIMDTDGKFVGFMTSYAYQNSTFSFDGVETLSIQVPEGQELYIDESGKGDAAWKDYNTKMMTRLNFQPYKSNPKFWGDVEYCTWVEQKQQSKVRKGHFKLLTHEFVKDYLDKIIAYGYPKGKMTLDHGWGLFPDGTIESGFGSWVPDTKTFPDFQKTMDMINNKGFTPGLWIAFPKIHHASTYAQRYPDMLGDWRSTKPSSPKAERWLNPQADIFEYASEVIHCYYKMGVMKFKIDMSYNTKADMLPIHKELYRAAKCIDKNIEMEFHVPDIFFTKHADVIRTNDIWINDKYDWQSRTKMHYEVSLKSSPGRGINLDHIGGNDTAGITEAMWLEHMAMYKNKKGYPLVSLLPHHVSQKCVDATGEYLWDYDKNGRDILSDFYI